MVYDTSILGELKDSINLKRALAGDGDWHSIIEILGWVINTSDRNLLLIAARLAYLADIKSLLSIPPTQHPLSRKWLERLIKNIYSMHLAISGAIRIFYWRVLIQNMKSRLNFLTKIVQHLPTNHGFIDASSLAAYGIWFTLNFAGTSFVWSLQWPEDIVADLVSFDNLTGCITNSNLKLAALVPTV